NRARRIGDRNANSTAAVPRRGSCPQMRWIMAMLVVEESLRFQSALRAAYRGDPDEEVRGQGTSRWHARAHRWTGYGLDRWTGSNRGTSRASKEGLLRWRI